MIKGNERRIIVIERMGDPYFEKAVFYVRCGVTSRKGGMSLADRAQQLFDEMTAESANGREVRAEIKAPAASESKQQTPPPSGFPSLFRRLFSGRKGS